VEGLRDALLNLILFIPLGAAFATWLRGRWAWLAPAVVTLLIEFSQYQWLVGRDASLRDLLTNTAGGVLGVSLVRGREALLRPGRSRARRLAGAALLAWLAIIGGSGLGMRRSLPETSYWGQWAPVLGHFAIYDGTVLDIRINDESLPNGLAANSARLRELLLEDSVLVSAKVISGEPPLEPAPIASVYDGLQEEIFVLGQSGDDLVFRVRNGLVAAGLAGQTIRMRDFPGHAPGDTVHVTGGVIRNHYLLRAEARAGGRSLTVPFSAGWGWTGLLPFPYLIGPEAALVTALWLGALMLPAGYWLGSGGGRAGSLGWIVVVTGLGLVGATALAGLPPGGWSEWLGSLTGGAAGWMLGRWADGRGAPRP